ncbi:hypothetical protein R1T08_25555 [Streptomyces sp. SBC-4]|nr:hypothetical protein [Streptomyces sp. SBC-4]MDV5147451.1 hypothetical protein [Streptomyces sp. SBC-4]
MTSTASGLYEALITQYLAQVEADQEPYYSVVSSLRGYAGSIWSDAGDANQHVQRLLSSGRGEALDALGQQWDKVMNQDVRSISHAAQVTAAAADEIAMTIATTKAQIVEIAAECAEITVAGLAAGALTFGASDGIVASAISNAQAMSQAVVSKCAQNIMSTLSQVQRDPSVAPLESIAAGLAGAIGGQARDGAADAGTGRAWGNDVAAGSGRAIAEGISVDHAEHERAAGRLREVAVEVFGTTAGRLSEAANHHATAAASGELGAAIASVLNTVLDDLAKGTNAFGDYLSGALPDGILLISSSQQATDDAGRKRMSELDR